MLPADWEEYLRHLGKELKTPADPPKRWQPHVTRHQSARMRIAERQTKNRVRASYVSESKYNMTPITDDEFRGVEREVGPNDLEPMFPAKETRERRAGADDGMARATRRKGGGSGRGRKARTQSDIDDMVKHYLTGG